MTTQDLSALKIHRDDDSARYSDRPRPGRKILAWIIGLAILFMAGWFAWRTDWLPKAAIEVRVTKPRLLQAGGVEEVLTATGYVVPQLRAVVSARTSGRLDWLGVDEGTFVTKGQVIARLSNDDLTALVTEAKAAVAESRARREQAAATEWEAGREVERQRNLVAQGITTQASFDAARRAHDVALAGVTAAGESVKVAQARVAITEANLDKTIVRAPFDGVVIAKSSEIGEMVAAGAFSGQPTGGAIVTVADFSTLEMEADVNENNIGRVKVGQAALITLDATPDRRYRAVVRQIVPTVDRQKAVVQAKLKFVEPDDRLVPDMSARVSFLTQEVSAEAASAPPRIFIPAAAIRMQDDLPFVMVVKEDRASLVKVRLGESRGEMREVTGGLTGQESLIETGGSGAQIRDGDKVRIAS